MQIYVNWKDFEGSVSTKDYAGWSQAKSVEFGGVGNSTSRDVGSQQDRLQSLPEFRHVVITKESDKSSVPLFERAHSRQTLDEVIIELVTTGDPARTNQRMILTDALVSHFSDSYTQGQNRAQEIIGLSYTTIQRFHMAYDETGQASSPIVSGYDLVQAQPL